MNMVNYLGVNDNTKIESKLKNIKIHGNLFLANILKRNIAKYDKRKSNVNGSYIINLSKYLYTFAIKNGYAILVTAHKN